MKRIVATAAVAAVMASALAVFGGPGATSAAWPECDWSRTFDGGAGLVIVPTRSEANPTDTSCQLGTGHEGRGVRRLQTSLNLCYFKDLEVDGIFGPQTRQALIEVQRLYLITADGIYGPVTRDRMLHQRNPGPPSCVHVDFPGGA